MRWFEGVEWAEKTAGAGRRCVALSISDPLSWKRADSTGLRLVYPGEKVAQRGTVVAVLKP
jgi:hypothetical protein